MQLVFVYSNMDFLAVNKTRFSAVRAYITNSLPHKTKNKQDDQKNPKKPVVQTAKKIIIMIDKLLKILRISQYFRNKMRKVRFSLPKLFYPKYLSQDFQSGLRSAIVLNAAVDKFDNMLCIL